jgi:hypothetical protein
MVVLTQGCGCGAAFTLGFAAPRFQRWIDSHAIQGRNFESHFRLHPGKAPFADFESFSVREQVLLFIIYSAQEGDLWLSFPLSSRNCLPKQT